MNMMQEPEKRPRLLFSFFLLVRMPAKECRFCMFFVYMYIFIRFSLSLDWKNLTMRFIIN